MDNCKNMTSKEYIITNIKDIESCKSLPYHIDFSDELISLRRVLKDLERLDQLEIEHQRLLNTINAIEKIITSDTMKMYHLEQENQALKEELKPYKLWDEIKLDMVNSMEGIALYGFHIQYIRNSEKHFGSEMAVIRGSTLEELMKENREFEKAIEILKAYILTCKPESFDTYITSRCTDEEIDLIKEQLSDE